MEGSSFEATSSVPASWQTGCWILQSSLEFLNFRVRLPSQKNVFRYCSSYCLSRICKSEHQVWWPLPFRVNASSWRAFSANPKGCIQPHLDLYSLFCILHFILFLRFSILGYLFWGETLCLGAPGIVSLFFILPFLSSIEGSCVSSLLKLATEFHMYWTQSVTVIYFKILLRKMKSECSII